MPRIRFVAKTHDMELDCPPGANLRMVLLHARLPLYTKVARALHCRGHGTCGTCAVEVEGACSEPTPAEERRLRMPPFHGRPGLRLACQCTVLGDVTVTKHTGLFGHHSSDGS